MAPALHRNIQLLLQGIIQHRTFVAIVFAIISSTTILVGANWAKTYTSSTSIFVEEENILGPLMEGAAVQTEVIDRAAIAREIIHGHKIMFKLLEMEGLLEKNPDPAVQEQLMNSIKGRMNISNIRRNLIRIEFRDNDPERAFRITGRLAELFIQESLAAKAQQSAEAFEFIDKQTREYKEKLHQSEQGLKKFRSENVYAQPGMPGEISRRTAELERAKEDVTQELKEARIRKASLERQLSGEAMVSSTFSRAEQYKTRIAELQAQLDDLLLSYHETYPDIVQIKTQIQDLRKAVAKTEDDSNVSSSTASRSVIDERVLNNPVYQQLQRDLYNTNTNIETMVARLEQIEQGIEIQLDRARKVEEYEARLQELTRDYEVNRDIYTDLIRRREQARVSMNLDKEAKGLNLRIDEPAYLPHSPSGLRFAHFVLAGPLAGLVLPIGFLFGLLKIDPRIRSHTAISENLGIPVLGNTPHLDTPIGARLDMLGAILSIFIILGSIAFIVTMSVLRIQGKI